MTATPAELARLEALVHTVRSEKHRLWADQNEIGVELADRLENAERSKLNELVNHLRALGAE